MIFLLSMKENSVVREGAAGLANILQFPDGFIKIIMYLLMSFYKT